MAISTWMLKAINTFPPLLLNRDSQLERHELLHAPSLCLARLLGSDGTACARILSQGRIVQQGWDIPLNWRGFCAVSLSHHQTFLEIVLWLKRLDWD